MQIRVVEVIVSLLQFFGIQILFSSLFFYPAQYLALLVGVIYFDQDYDQEGVQNIDGALFWVCMNQFFSTYTSMLTARELPLKIKKADSHKKGNYCFRSSPARSPCSSESTTTASTALTPTS